MKAVVQRVKHAQITIDAASNRTIGEGFVVLLGVMEGDSTEQADFLAKKIVELRVFTDDKDKMNRSLNDIGGEMLIVSNFTLAADCKKGRRPSFDLAARPEAAKKLYNYFVEAVRQSGQVRRVETGEFGADMQIALVNDGPVTLMIDTQAIGR